MTDNRYIQTQGNNVSSQLDYLGKEIVEAQKINDKLQRLADVDDENIEKNIEKQLNAQGRSLNNIKDQILNIESKSKDIEHKNRVKKLKQAYIKESDRYESIYEQLKSKPKRNSSVRVSQIQEQLLPQQQYGLQRQTDKSSSIMKYQAELDNQILQQNQEDIDYIDEHAKNLNKLIKDIAMEVQKQDVGLDIVQFNQIDTRNNVFAAEEELNKANQMSGKSRKCYCIVALIASLIAIGFVLLIFRKSIGI